MGKISSYATDSSPVPSFEFIGTDPTNTSMASSGTTLKVPLTALGYAVDHWHDLVRDYGADPTGGTSIATSLANACTAAVAAQPATFGLKVPPGKYLVTASQDLPWNMVLQGAGAEGGDVTSQFTGTWFNLPSSFTGTYVFGFRNNADHTSANGCMVSGIGIDGSAHTSGAVDGMFISGPTNVVLQGVRIAQMPGWGVNASGTDPSAAEQFPYGQAWDNVTVDSCGVVSGGGFNLVGCEDSVFTECYSIGNNNGPGFLVNACDNTKFTACNAEWNSNYGFYVTGDWQWFTGGCIFTGCSTDANGQFGFYIDATWTTGGGAGTGPGIIHVTGSHFRRDGQVDTATSAGIALGATTLPLIISGFSTMPSIGDGGTGSMAPAYGVQFLSSSYPAPVVICNGLAWGLTDAVKTTSGTTMPSNTTTFTSSGVLLAHGNNYAPTYGS